MLKKQCRKCKEWKNLECFGKDKSRKSGKFFQCKECQNKYYKEHKEGLLGNAKKYYQEHKKETNQYQRNRRIIDPMYRLNSLMSRAIGRVKNSSIKNGRSWKSLVPYTLTELKKHLKKTLPKGYTWNDFMQGKLHIDHILPKAIFQYEKAEDLGFQICWGLNNLRLLSAKENLRKNSKLIKPFQKNFDIEVKIK